MTDDLVVPRWRCECKTIRDENGNADATLVMVPVIPDYNLIIAMVAAENARLEAEKQRPAQT